MLDYIVIKDKQTKTKQGRKDQSFGARLLNSMFKVGLPEQITLEQRLELSLVHAMPLQTLFPLSGMFFHGLYTNLETSSDLTSSMKYFPVSLDYLIYLFV